MRIDSVRPPLVRPYEGPFRVLARNAKSFRLLRLGKPWIVSVDRLKPALGPAPATPLPSAVLSTTAPVFQQSAPNIPDAPGVRAVPDVPAARAATPVALDPSDPVEFPPLGPVRAHVRAHAAADEDVAVDADEEVGAGVDTGEEVGAGVDAEEAEVLPTPSITRSGRVSVPPQRYGL